MLRIEAFGDLSIVRDERRIPLGNAEPPVCALLTLLVVCCSAGVTRARATALLAPRDHDQSAWWEATAGAVRALLGDAHLVEKNEHIALDARTVTSDVGEFVRAVAGGHLDRAVQLYRGPLVDGVRFHDMPAFGRWLSSRREALAKEAAAAAVKDPLAAFRDVLSARYRIEGEIGRGGHGRVLRATDLRRDRAVAIKVLRPELGSSLGAARFAREIRVAASLQHPHILPLLDSGTAAGTVYFVMPFVDSGSLRQRLDRDRALPLLAALDVARQVAKGLDGAHRAGVVHRDVKPENILLDGGVALLADFGIAAVIDSRDATTITAPGTVVGTPDYMSPEQASPGAIVDARADLYSLGCVLWEMLTGSPVFPGPNPLAVIAAHGTAPVPDLVMFRRDAPRSLGLLLRRVLAKHANDRYASAESFVAAIDAVVLDALRAAPPFASIVRKTR